jgi:hypothetical protein
MIFPIKITDWTVNQYELILQVLGVFIIVVLLVYVGLSSKETE